MDSQAAEITRAKSEELDMAAMIQSLSRATSSETIASTEMNDGSSHSRKASFGRKVGSSPPGRTGGHQIRKTRSGQLKLDLEDVGSGAALSRASSASVGFSFSFTGFSAPPEDIIDDLRSFSDDDNGNYTAFHSKNH